MEFVALPSQGAKHGLGTSGKKSDGEGNFEEVLEKTLKESGMIGALPSFAAKDNSLQIQRIDSENAEGNEKISERIELSRGGSSKDAAQGEEVWRKIERNESSEREPSDISEEPGPNNAQDAAVATSVSIGTGSSSAVGTNPQTDPISSVPSLASRASGSQVSGMKGMPPSLKPADLPQVMLRIASSLQEGGETNYRANLKLNPEKLGTLDIELKLESGRLSVSIRADQEAAREALEAEIERLRSVLEGQGFTEVSLELSFGKDAENSGTGERTLFSQGTEWEESPSSPDSKTGHWDGLINLLA